MALADISVPIELRCRKREFSERRLHAFRFCMISGTDRQLSATLLWRLISASTY
jgi:hypothetical protein